jgi:(1->4)-alpha-D-glucan 1-alpha-D-glucosylmutase
MRKEIEDGAEPRRQVPLATYRLQFNRQFGFRQAADVASYLRELGVSDVYASPLLEAVPNSSHGYDICSYERVNPDLGLDADFDFFTRRLRESGMGLLLDIVPNHMACDCANDWWFDVLAKGPGSAYAQWFDVNWRPLNPALQNKVLLPVLEDHYANVLETGKLRLVKRGQPCPHQPVNLDNGDESVCAPDQDGRHVQDGGHILEFGIGYHDKIFPLSPRTSAALAKEASTFGLDATLARFNGAAGAAHSFDPLHELLEQQYYRLAFWRTGLKEINYRRFFDIPELVSLRMESEAVFEATHRLILKWIKEGKVTGLRIDHPDGLWDPRQYLSRLRQRSAASHPAPFTVVEKILTGDEQLPEDWPVDGTTGYDFLNHANRLFLDAGNEGALDSFYREFTGSAETIAEVVRRSKRKILQTSFVSEFNALAWRLKRVAATSRYGKDYTFQQLEAPLEELIVSFPVYRTYINFDKSSLSEAELKYFHQAFAAAGRAAPKIEPGIWTFFESLFLLQASNDLAPAGLRPAREFIMRFQQLTGRVMAKGVEDTAFYNYNRLVAMNEVGGDPDNFGGGAEEFHECNLRQAARWPHSLLTTATHDTKRGEDVRARINVLSELLDEWRDAVEGWRRLNAHKKRIVAGKPAPEPNDEYLFYQTLVGAWPSDADTVDGLNAFRERVSAYMLKAAREAKARTSWTNPNGAYEEATSAFVERLLDSSSDNAFITAFRPFQRKVDFFGRFNSLSQELLKLTSPGVPDFYQGTELWDFSLVDPDNRRSVDFGLRRRSLDDMKCRFSADPLGRDAFLHDLAAEEQIGLSKLFLIWRTLQFRRQYADAFTMGDYIPLRVTGAKERHVCAYARKHADQVAVIIVPRLVATLTGGEIRELGEEIWRDTAVCLPNTGLETKYRNALTGETLQVTERDGEVIFNLHEALRLFPVALFEPIATK